MGGFFRGGFFRNRAKPIAKSKNIEWSMFTEKNVKTAMNSGESKKIFIAKRPYLVTVNELKAVFLVRSVIFRGKNSVKFLAMNFLSPPHWLKRVKNPGC